MRHLGDITKLKGTTVEPVNVVIGGSPCQDLSIAGRREGLAGERSGLFMEQIRLIKEMRDADIHRGRSGKDVRPRFMVWENVPGAFSSNKGKDFAAVLEETVRVVLKEAPDIPVPKNGWPTAGCISVGGDRPVSVAYRVFDSQFWGVPQRRRRISLVADFAGGCAPEILFEREGMQGDHQAGRETWERITGHAQAGAAGDDRVLGNAYTLKIRSGCDGGGKGALVQEDLSATLSTLQDQTLFQPTGNYTPWDVQSRQIIDEDGIWPSLYAGEGGGRGYVLRKQGSKAHGMGFAMEQAPTIIAGANEGVVICFDRAPTAYSFDSMASNSMKSKNPHSGCREVDIAKTLDTSDPNPCKNQGGIAVVQAYSVENHPADGRMRIDESGKAQTLTERMGTGGGNVPMVMFENHSQDSRYTGPLDVAQPVTATYGMGGNNQPFVIEEKPICMATQQGGAEIMEDKCPTITAAAGMSGNNQPVVTVPIHDKATRHMGKHGDKHDGAGNGLGIGSDGDPMYTLTSGDHHAICTDVGFFNTTEDISTALLARMYKDPPLVTIPGSLESSIRSEAVCCMASSAVNAEMTDGNVSPTLMARAGTGGNQLPLVGVRSMETHYIVRRLTPLECERLQGFPDGWTDIGDWTDSKGKTRKGDSDAPRYKALGNSIALPPWCYVLTRLSLVCGGEQTMGSLFDGIGGFPIIWETINGKGTCLWASEIEEFPIAVTQKRFNGEEET